MLQQGESNSNRLNCFNQVVTLQCLKKLTLLLVLSRNHYSKNSGSKRLWEQAIMILTSEYLQTKMTKES